MLNLKEQDEQGYGSIQDQENTPVKTSYSDEEEKEENGSEKETPRGIKDILSDLLFGRLFPFIAFVTLGSLWGAAFAFIKLAVDPDTGFPPMAMVALRLIIGGWGLFFVLIISMVFDKKLRAQVWSWLTPKTLFHLTFMGTFNNVIPFVLVGYAEGPLLVNVGIASILDSTIPLFAIALGHFFLPTEKLNLLKVIGLFIGFTGVILVCLQSINIGTPKPFRIEDVLGFIMVTLAAASYGVASVYAKRYLNNIPGLMAATGQVLSGSFITVVLMLIVDLGIDVDHFGFWARNTWGAWGSILYLGVASTLFAYLMYFYLIRTVGSTKQSMVGYLLPVLGVFIGAMFFGDWDDIPWFYIVFELVGTFLIVAGIATVSLPPDTMRRILRKLGRSPPEDAPLTKTAKQEDYNPVSEDEETV
mmetsp:Transcript_8593/g.12667  ORF Transcript_8593/g.12667 Transcript_8593/m.12667 type:complete len:416 (-) Transcript_8593:15-1262(-)